VASLLVLLASPQLALGGTSTVQDPNDRPGPLDIRSVSQGHAGERVKHTIRTFGHWSKALLGPDTPNFFALQVSTDSDPRPERIVVIFSTPGRMVAGVFRPGGDFVGRATASHPNGHTAVVVIRRALLGNPAGYRWQAASSFRGNSTCRGGCIDRAPNGARVLHDLRDPTVNFPDPPVPSSTTYNLDFTVTDAGGSGLDFWRLEQRDEGETAWTTLEEDLTPTTGPQSVPFTADMPGDTDQFRVVAEDNHGNRTVSPIRTVVLTR
jgi:hypothetical protein